MFRRPLNKASSAAKFRRQATHTKAANMKGPGPRGGFRL